MQPTPLEPAAALRNGVVLLVRNHPGVMSHVCGLFARRAFNVEGILCVAVGDATCSAIFLLVHEDQRLEQLVCQLRKLEDVLDIYRAPRTRAPRSPPSRGTLRRQNERHASTGMTSASRGNSRPR